MGELHPSGGREPRVPTTGIRGRGLAAALALAVALAAGAAEAQENAPQASTAPSLQATRITTPIVLDGIPNEEGWSQAEPATQFTQRDPREGTAATERTEVRILYDTLNIYFAVVCEDTNPAGIRATELRRDNGLGSDDIFEIILDTFHDRRNGYLFRINPLGTQYDATVTAEGQTTNVNWDDKWTSQARIGDDGWTAEIAIPFKSVRFLSGEDIVWGVNFHRRIMSKNEDVFWTAYDRDYDFEEVSRAGRLEGLSGIEGFRFRLKPYVATGASRVFDDDQFQSRHLTDSGIEVAKYLVTPQLTLDATVNPDFAQAEVDQAQVNLTRFPVFFPERREFFQEGAGIFQVGTDDEGDGGALLFNSRRIGLFSGEEIRIFGGAKLTGKQGRYDLGVLNMQTDRFEDRPGQNFSVARVKANILRRSFIGGIVTRNTEGAIGPMNVTSAVDGSFTFVQNLNFRGFLAKSDSRDSTGTDMAGQARVEWDSDRFGFTLDHVSVQQNFRPPMGFVRRANIKTTTTEATYSPRPRIPHVRQIEFQVASEYISNQAGALQGRTAQASFQTEFQSGDEIELQFSRTFDRLDEEFDIEGGAIIPAGDYRINEWQASFESYDGRPISGEVQVGIGDFYTGRRLNLDMSPQFRVTPNLSIVPSYEWNRVSMPDGTRFSTHEFNGSVNYAFSRKWLTRVAIQVNSQDREYLVNFRLNYIYRPGDDMFLVYNETRTYGAGATSGLLDRAFILKFTYSLDR